MRQHNSNLAYRVTEAALNPLDLLPLARGARWIYDYAYNYYWVGAASGTVRIQRWGAFELAVRGEHNRWDGRRFTVRTRLDIRCRYGTQDTFASGRENSVIRRIDSARDWELALLRDALWYDRGSQVEFMLPASFTNGGFVDLRIFNYPGVPDFPGRFDQFGVLLGPGRFGAGHYVYRADIPGAGIDTRAAVFSAASEGVLSLESVTRRSSRDETLSERLELRLRDRTPGRLAW